MIIKTFKAFTLIELMVVVIIIAILAGMAVPTFTKSMENAREKEARTTLTLIYNAQRMYRIDKKGYAGGFSYLTSYAEDPNAASRYYDYDIVSAGASSFTATATRKNDASKVLTVDETGNITP